MKRKDKDRKPKGTIRIKPRKASEKFNINKARKIVKEVLAT
jgi:hypothetical protein